MNSLSLFSSHKKIILLLSISFLAFAFTIKALDVIKLVAETNHSTVGFSVPISNGLTRITGKFTDFSIDINYVDKYQTKSSFSVSINIASINTGIPARDEDLKTKDFFEIDKYPQATFLSDSISKTNAGFITYGKFQMHGITKNIALPFRITGMDGDDIIGFSSRYVLKRSDFGVGTEFKHTTDDNFIGNDINIEIDFWTKRAKEK